MGTEGEWEAAVGVQVGAGAGRKQRRAMREVDRAEGITEEDCGDGVGRGEETPPGFPGVWSATGQAWERST